MSDNSNNSGGIGVFGLLGVLFIGLKICGVITWSWWYVTLPLWGGLALFATIALISFPIYLLMTKKGK